MKPTNSIQNLFSLSNKNIILTGSAGRLGTQFAHFLTKAGANVILVDIDYLKNKKLEANLKKNYKTNPKSYEIDISDQNEVKKFTSQIIKDYKTIHGLINNAFYSPRQNAEKAALPFEKFPIDLWNDMLNVNLTGVFLCCKEIGKVMVKQKSGVIVNISSIYGMVGADQRIYGKSRLNSSISYATTKGGIVNMTRYLAAYWQNKNIRVNTLTLGGVLDTSYMTKEFIMNYEKKTMLGRMAKEVEYGPALLFLMSDASSYMTGANLVVDGGWTAW
ncbi:MAG: SDR family oxidoreductase [Nitrosarchaeum sp.]